MTLPGVFALGRMRHLDLLALYYQLHPGKSGDVMAYTAATLSKECLAAAILGPAQAEGHRPGFPTGRRPSKNSNRKESTK